MFNRSGLLLIEWRIANDTVEADPPFLHGWLLWFHIQVSHSPWLGSAQILLEITPLVISPHV